MVMNNHVLMKLFFPQFIDGVDDRNVPCYKDSNKIVWMDQRLMYFLQLYTFELVSKIFVNSLHMLNWRLRSW